MGNIAVSPCSNPEMALNEALKSYAALGYRKFEVFTGWANSRFDLEKPPEFYLNKGRQYGMEFSSMHLPPIEQDIEAGVANAVEATRFAAAIGACVVLFKAATAEGYIRAAPPYLDAIEGLNVTAVLQNHAGTAISTLEDYARVIEGIGDARMKTTLEVGHFHSVGVSWRQGCDLLAETIALVHIKDQIGRQPVPFGTGKIDLPGLFSHMNSAGYTGDFVVEMELRDAENTLECLGQAARYLQEHCQGAEL